MENYRLALSRATSLPLPTETPPLTIHSLHIIKHSPTTPWSATVPPLVTTVSDPKPEPPPVREAALVHLRRMKYTLCFASPNARTWKVADHTKTTTFRTSLRIRTLSASPTDADIDFGAPANAGIEMLLRQKLQRLQVPTNGGQDEDKWKGPWLLYCMLERYGLDFEFAVWTGEREKTALRNFFQNGLVMEEVLSRESDRGRERRRWDVEEAVGRLLQWRPAPL
ncbi:hypothetical protein PMIN04_001490 [Paraphaeosphaeria minitans]